VCISERKIGFLVNFSHFCATLKGEGIKTVKRAWPSWPLDPPVAAMILKGCLS